MANKLIIKVFLIVLLFGIGIAVAEVVNLKKGLEDIELEANGGLPVNIQDQTTRPFDIQVNQILSTAYSITVSPTINTRIIELNTTIGLSTDDKIAFLEENGMPQIYFGFITAISGNNITMNSPVPYNFTPSLAVVFTFDNQLNVDGSTTTQVFSLVNSFNEEVDITRIIFKCTDDVEMHDGLFCGIAQLTNGITFRKYTNDGYYIDYFNIRNNAKWGLIAYDVQYTDTGKPPSDVYGFGSRLTYAGQNKHGVTIRLEQGERIELLIQDDLTGISGASLMVEGHFVQN